MRPADLPLDRQHRAGPVLLWDAFAVLTEVTVVYRRTGRRRRRLWTWGEHLPPSSAVRKLEHGGQAIDRGVARQHQPELAATGARRAPANSGVRRYPVAPARQPIFRFKNRAAGNGTQVTEKRRRHRLGGAG